ncbi:hypothetical protein O9929_08585 [Vibrio lentus]|nr:hypothetical protein [Vibrio lentus]
MIHSKGTHRPEELIAYAKEVKAWCFQIPILYIAEIANRCIFLDNKKGAYLATEYLIRHGHRKHRLYRLVTALMPMNECKVT